MDPLLESLYLEAEVLTRVIKLMLTECKCLLVLMNGDSQLVIIPLKVTGIGFAEVGVEAGARAGAGAGAGAQSVALDDSLAVMKKVEADQEYQLHWVKIFL